MSRRIMSRHITSRRITSRLNSHGAPFRRPLPSRHLHRAFHGVARDAPPEEMAVGAGGESERDLLAGEARLGEPRGLEAAARDRPLEVLVALAQVQLVLPFARGGEPRLPATRDARGHNPQVHGGARYAVDLLLLG